MTQEPPPSSARDGAPVADPESGRSSSRLVAPPPRPGPPTEARRPRLSVVIAAYNASAVIATAVRSALGQSEAPHEVIVCDDGSADGAALEDALRPFGNDVRLVRCVHGGESRAKNTAVAWASGDVVVVLDADDYWHPDRLRALADAFVARPDLGLITTDAFVVRDGEVLYRYYERNTFETANQRREMLRRTFVFGHFAVRREAWLRVGGFAEALRIGADWDFTLRLVMDGVACGLVARPLAYYVQTPGSLSGTRSPALQARVTLLTKAKREQRLTAEEEAVRAAATAKFQRRAVIASARERAQGTVGSRQLLRAAVTPGIPLRGRLGYGAVALVPPLLLQRVRRRTGT